MIALDIDGTTLRHDTSLSPRVRDAIHAHLDAGTRIMLATGRGVAGTQVALEVIGMDHGVAVCSNGAVIVSLGSTFPDEQTREIPDFVKTGDVPVRLLREYTFNPEREIEILGAGLPDAIFAVESLTRRTRITAPFPPGELSGETDIVPLSELAVPNATRLTVRTPDMTAFELLEAVRELGLQGVEYSVGWTAWMDIAPDGISKAAGLEGVRAQFDIDPANTICIGDSGNDNEMLRWAGVGIAMGNAPEYVRANADAITDHVDEDGSALVLEALL
ncbi:MAG: HAD family phosphatase [Actinomycetaceae bacterium]|nr:HAD family phosphatase [Actinomycetaceae bacterium]